MLRPAQKGKDMLQLAREILAHFRDVRGLRVASALSFTSLLALVPLVTVVFSMLSLFPVFETWSVRVEDFLFSQFVPTAGDAVRQYLHEFSSKAGQLTAVGLLFLLLSSLLLLSTIEDSFNDIWKVPRGRQLFHRLLVYWAVITLGPVLITASLSMSSALLSLSVFDDSILAGATSQVLRYLPFLLELGAFILFYKAIPNTEVSLRHAFIGGVVATVLFETAKYGFAAYILNFRSYQLIYGALATVPIFFLWIYLSWVVMLIGAVVAAVLNISQPEADGDGG